MAKTRKPLNRERILESALALADENGLDAISMRKLGQELGFEAMSLYNHVDGRPGLLRLVSLRGLHQLTEAISAAEQQKMFHLPPGFEIQLVAAEPEIRKPMNLNFDARGRLWITHSIEVRRG